MLSNYQIYYYENGKVKSVHNSYGEQLKFDPVNKIFDESDPLVVQLRMAENEAGIALDLSDRPFPVLSLEAAKAIKSQEIIDLAKAENNKLVADYAPAEQASWDRKLDEAKAIISSNDIVDAPLLEFEAIEATGVDPSDDLAVLQNTLYLAQRIVDKSELLYQTTARITGQRARLWNEIEAATTNAEVEAIAWQPIFY